MSIDAQQAYNKYFTRGQPAPLWDGQVNPRAQNNAGNAGQRGAQAVQPHGPRNSPNEQFELDVAFWFGTLLQGNANEIEFLKRVFTVLYYGGLLYYGSTGWATWASSGIPIAAALSHGGRVLIQLPRVRSGNADAFLQWLQGPSNIITNNSRLAATHGIEPFSAPFPINGVNRWHRLNEIKSGGKGRHYGVNISLGGTGNINPLSGNVIASDGEHGHLYVYYLPPTDENYGGLLIGLEGSAPIDAWDNRSSIGHTPGTKGRSGKAGIAGYAARAWAKDKLFHDPTLFTPDQTGGYHKFGERQRYSPTGNAKWEQLPVGPRRVYNGMLVDLAEYGWEFLINKQFSLDMLGQSGRPPRPGHPVPLPGQLGPVPPIVTKTCLIEANLKRLSTVVEQINTDTAAMRAGHTPMVKDYNVTHTKKTMFGLRTVKDHKTEKSAEMLNPKVTQFAHDAILDDNPMDSTTWQKFSSVRLASRSLLHAVDTVLDECLRLTARELRQTRALVIGGRRPADDRTITERRRKLIELVQTIKRYLDMPQAQSDGHTPKVQALHLLVLTELKLLDSAKGKI